jgi:hypothetical protein
MKEPKPACLRASALERDANPSEEQPFPLSDEELLELAVMICLVAGVGSSSRAHEPEVAWWGGV